MTGSNEGAIVGIELVVQILDEQRGWRDWRSPFSDLFPEEGARQLKQARTGYPARKFRLVRRTLSVRVEEITEDQLLGGAA